MRVFGEGTPEKLADEKVGALPVLDARGSLVGMVSYVDVLRALAAGSPAGTVDGLTLRGRA